MRAAAEKLKSIFKVALSLTIGVVALAIVLILAGASVENSSVYIAALTSAFTCISVIWIASGIYLSQEHLRKYSEELRDHREELAQHTAAFDQLNESLRVSALIQLTKHALDELGDVEKSIRKEMLGTYDPKDGSTLHSDRQIFEEIEKEISRHGRDTLMRAVERYCTIFENLRNSLTNHQEAELLKDVLLHGSNEAKNYTVLSNILLRKKHS